MVRLKSLYKGLREIVRVGGRLYNQINLKLERKLSLYWRKINEQSGICFHCAIVDVISVD